MRRAPLPMTGGIGSKQSQQLNNVGTHPRNVTGGNTATGTRPRPQPIAGTPPPDPSEKCADQKMIQQTCTLFGLDLVCIFLLNLIFNIIYFSFGYFI